MRAEREVSTERSVDGWQSSSWYYYNIRPIQGVLVIPSPPVEGGNVAATVIPLPWRGGPRQRWGGLQLWAGGKIVATGCLIRIEFLLLPRRRQVVQAYRPVAVAFGWNKITN